MEMRGRYLKEGYVPYGWQFKEEKVCIRSAKGKHLNCFGIITLSNHFVYQTTTQTINSDFIIEQLDELSLTIKSIPS